MTPRLPFIALLLVVMYGTALVVDVPLIDPSEGLHAAIAREMAERGDWQTPRRLGVPFRDKPPLYFWLQAAALSLCGPTAAAVRLPGLVLAAAGAVTTGILAARLCGGRVGRLATCFYATMFIPTALAQVPVHDVALVPLVNLALLGLWTADRATAPAPRLWAAVGTGVAVGLAILVKGLPGAAVVGIAYGLFRIADAVAARAAPAAADPDAPGPFSALVLTGGIAAVVALAVAAPWYLAAEARDPGYLRYFFLERHVAGFTTDEEFHGGRPWWYYLPILLLGGLPAIASLPAALVDARRAGRLAPGVLLAGAWLVGGFLFFSAAGSKLVTYLWPVFPPVAILAATAWNGVLAGIASAAALRWTARAVVLTCGIGCLALPVAAFVVDRTLGVTLGAAAVAAVGLATALSLAPLVCWHAGRPAACVTAGFVAVAAHLVVVMTCLVPQAANRWSARDRALDFNAAGRVVGVPEPGRDIPGSLLFYLDPPLRRSLEAAAAARAAAAAESRRARGRSLTAPPGE